MYGISCLRVFTHTRSVVLLPLQILLNKAMSKISSLFEPHTELSTDLAGENKRYSVGYGIPFQIIIRFI